MAKKNFFRSLKMINNFSPRRLDKILRKEPRIDMYEDKLGTFLVKLSGKDISEEDSNEISKLLHCIGDFERIGDHGINILKIAQEMNEKQIMFSDEAKAEIQVAANALSEIAELTMKAFCEDDLVAAKRIEPLEQVVDIIISEIKDNHVKRLQDGKCTIELGFMLNDLLNTATTRVQPPTDKGKRLKIYYCTQASVKPPTFVFFCNNKELFHFSYQRYLENRIRETFGLEGTPIRIIIRERGEKK